MKNILSSLNESEKKRILEMHYRASGRHYLNEAVNADYNVIKTSMDATYGETMKTYLMSTVTLQGQDESGKPTQIKFNPTNPLGTIKRKNQIMGTDVDVDVLDPVYSCVDIVFLERVNSVFEYQKAYASSIGATGQMEAATARSTWEIELKKIGAAGCKAISDLSKGLPNPLIKVTTSPVIPQEKKPLPATKGTGSVASSKVIGDPPNVITAGDLKTIGLPSDGGPAVTGDGVEQQLSSAPYGGYFYWGGARFECYDPYKGALVYNFTSPPYNEPQKSAYTAYKTQMVALGKKQCLANATWYKTAQHIYYDKEGKEIGRGVGPKK